MAHNTQIVMPLGNPHVLPNPDPWKRCEIVLQTRFFTASLSARTYCPKSSMSDHEIELFGALIAELIRKGRTFGQSIDPVSFEIRRRIVTACLVPREIRE
jgi:hypothetical protein